MPEPTPPELSLKSLVESLIFVSAEPVSVQDLARALKSALA